MSLEPPAPAVLPLDRAAENLRRARRLVALFALIAFPSVAYVGQYIAFIFLLWMVPLFGALGWIVFLTLDFLLVLGLMALTFRWLYSSATARLLRAVKAEPVAEGEETEFVRVAQNLSIASGIPQPRLFVIEETAPNLLAIGISPGDSALVVTRGLLDAFERRELEGAVAHAYAQIGNGDTRLDTLLAAGVRFLRVPGNAVLAACRGLGRMAAQFGAVGWGCLVLLAAWMLIPLALAMLWGLTDPDFWWICWIALTFLVYIFFAAPVLAAVVARSVSRERKHLADAEAVQLTRLPVGLARALAKADAAGSAYAGAPPEAANLYFADPIAGGAGWWARLTDSHPPAAERIEVASRLGGKVPPNEIEEAAMAGASFAVRDREAGPPPPPAIEAAVVVPASPPGAGRTVVLLEDVPLLSTPKAGSDGRGTVDAGTRVTVIEDAEDFVRIITPDDRIGWVSKLARTSTGD